MKDLSPKKPRTVDGWYVTEEKFPSDPIGRLIYYARLARVQPVSQVLEVPEMRAEIARIFNLGDRVSQHLFRLGHAEAQSRRSARRPV